MPASVLFSSSPGLPVATDTSRDAAVSAGLSHGANTAVLIPGSQPLIAVGAVAGDVPTLISQLASIQTSLMATALYSSVPPSFHGSSMAVPNIPSQSADSANHGSVTSQMSDHGERP